jgi:oxygen-independent coproporphyrinogen-3 oxidase
LSENSLPVKRGIEIDRDDTLRGEVIQELMCYDRLIFSDFEKVHGIEFSSYFLRELERLEPLAKDGLVQIDDQQISITPKGRLLLRSIAMVFDRYLNADDNNDRYSKAI